jgi:hypothetical protein
MGMFPPGAFQFPERIVEANIERIRRDRQSSHVDRHRATRPPRRPGWYRRALVWLGCQLAAWGDKLQEQFSSAGAACGPQSVEHPAAR